MKLTRYTYSGPRSSASLRVGTEVLDVQLIPGKPCELPAGHEYTGVLLALKHLVSAPADKVAAPVPVTADKKGGKA